MKTPLLLALLVALLCYYYHDSAAPTPAPAPALAQTSAAAPVRQIAHPQVVIASAPAAYARWKTGPNAQTDLKTGPDAQTHFEPFAPSEHASWNQGSPGYTIIAGGNVRR